MKIKNVTFHEDARAELAEASHYYEDRVSGLGYDRSHAGAWERSRKNHQYGGNLWNESNYRFHN